MQRIRLVVSVVLAAIAASFGGARAQEAEQWNQIYEQGRLRYRMEPNEFLDRMLVRLEGERGLAGKKALDLAMGDGRNALLLARHGFAVTGIDISTVALQKARVAAKAQGLTLDAREADLFAFDYGVEQWDLITIIYFNPAIEIVDRLKRAVRPGGVIVIEGQGSEHLGGGPPPKTRFGPNALVKTFVDWRILAYEDGRFESDWNPGGTTHVVRLMARKPVATPARP